MVDLSAVGVGTLMRINRAHTFSADAERIGGRHIMSKTEKGDTILLYAKDVAEHEVWLHHLRSNSYIPMGSYEISTLDPV